MATPGDSQKRGSGQRESIILMSSGSQEYGDYGAKRPLATHAGDATRDSRDSRAAGRYVPAKGELFEKRETRLDNDRKRVTYILQTSGSHDRRRGDFDRPSGDERLTSTDSHCHSMKPKNAPDTKARRKLILASVLCLMFMIGETAGGLIAGSLAIISDAAHLLTDFASFMISLMALYLAQRPATKRLSFGWYRIEILGALMSILMLWVLTGILVYSAAERIVSADYEIDATIMLITAATGVAFNIVLGTTLHQHSHSHGGGHGHSHGGGGHGHSHGKGKGHSDSESDAHSLGGDGAHHHHNKEDNINVKAAFVHVVGDFFQSIGVLVAAFIIYYKPEWKIADPICTFLFSVFVLITTITILRDILVVLMEGTPRGINFAEVREAFFQVEGVLDIHNLRVWSLTMDKIALSVHIAVDKNADPHDVLRRASKAIQRRFAIAETTMQIEEYVTEMDNCVDCQGPKL
ncbi:hypothetical protein EGW08_023020 [Elysia chlorotica]|uniref:Zinc transporter 2-like n=1 Tax=Elysia chlorotica TaxID=188477 RepID=A0A433SJH8_ELYCH|nr:hypothetical protein EGW08_023020 [Elysia chlorotica]